MEAVSTRTLPVITDEIRYLDAQATRLVLGHAMEIGRRLTEAKAMVPYGEWGNYIRNELGYSQSTAENLMRVYERFGSAQMGLFGPEAKSETIGNLTYTKAVKLLAVPEEALDDFLQAHPVEDMSTRELEKAIAEAKAAKKQAEKAEQDRAYAEEKLQEARAALAEAEQKLKNADSGELEALKAEAEKAKTRADAAEVKTLFGLWQEQYRKITESVKKLDAETAEKMLGAIRKQAEIWATT